MPKARRERGLSKRCGMVSLPPELNRETSTAAGIVHTRGSLDPGRWKRTQQVIPSTTLKHRGTACRCRAQRRSSDIWPRFSTPWVGIIIAVTLTEVRGLEQSPNRE